MGTLADAKETIRALISSLTGLDAIWEAKNSPYIDSSLRAIVLLRIGAAQTVGVDELYSEWDASQVGLEWGDTAIAQRLIPIRIKVKSYEQEDEETAAQYLERLSVKLRWQSSTDSLNSVQCGVATIGEIQDLEVTEDDREVSMASLDLTLNATFTEVDPNRYGYIAVVTGTATLGGKTTDYELDLT